MAKMWGIFPESGPPLEIPENLYRMEIFHGGFFDKKLDATRKYKVPRFNKLGGKIYLDGLDPELISWVEMNNIAHALGYREKPISYHFKVPRTPPNEGFIQIKSDGDAIEMVKMIPLKKRQITVYITGGGPRKKEEAYAEFALPPDPDFVNPLNNQTSREKERAFFEANLMASQLYSEPDGVNAVGGSSRVNADVEPVVIDLEDDSGSGGNVVKDGSGVNVEGGASQSTFAGLSDIVPDIMGSQPCASQGEVGQSGNTATLQGHMGNLQPPKAKPRRVKHTVKRSWPASAREALNKKLEDIERRAREEAERREKEEFERAQKEAAELRESQAAAELREREEAEKREREASEKRAREEAELREKEASEKRARDALDVRQQLAAELEKRRAEKQTSKAAPNKGKEHVHHKAKANKRGRKPREPRYNTRHKGQEKFEAQVEEDEDSSDESDFYVDSDYDVENDEFDDVQFEEHVTEPSDVPEFEEMGFTGYCSEEPADSDDLQSLSGSESEEDEDGNPIPKKSKKGFRVRPWNRSVDLKNPKFRLGLAFPNSAQLKEAVRECAIRNQVGLWFEKNSKKKIEVYSVEFPT